MKVCRQCRENKANVEFANRQSYPDGLSPRCKKCVETHGKNWRPPGPKRTDKDYFMANRYGITQVDVDELLKKQEGRCPICCQFLDAPHVDHCHKTGLVRGLLCSPCNLAIGLLKDSPGACTRAAEYLLKARAASA